MKIRLFNKSSSIQNSAVYIAYLILKKSGIREAGKQISIFKLLGVIKNIEPGCNAKQFMYALMLLFLMGIVEFDKPYVRFNYVKIN